MKWVFLGTALGMGYTLWNLAGGQRVSKKAYLAASSHGEMLDMDLASRLRFCFLVKPAKFVRPQDGECVRQATMRILAMRKYFIRHHVPSGLLVILGGFMKFAIELGVRADS